MGLKEIPAAYEYRCDSCPAVVLEKTKVAFPTYWSKLTLAQHSYDYQGCAVADGTITRLLCQDCTAKVAAAINEATKKQAA